MGLLDLLGRKRARDKPRNSYEGQDFSYLFGRTTSGENVDEFKAMQTTAVYACVRILAEAVASLPIHVYERTATGKEKMVDHPLYFLLHDEPNPEMSSFVFRETLMTHLLIWGNAYVQIIRDRSGQVISLYPLLPDKMSVHRDASGKLYYKYKRQNGRLIINPGQAETVKFIYEKFLEGYSPESIAKYLNDNEIPGWTGKANWYPSAIQKMLQNEKYKGDALLQKTFTVDFLTKK
ncbi:phage portal protein [Streptococcus suis]|nr:phage portal protein [Streptococcus suis]